MEVEVGVASFNNPLFPVCLLFNALRSKELNLLNAGLVEIGAATCNSCEPRKIKELIVNSGIIDQIVMYKQHNCVIIMISLLKKGSLVIN